MTTKENTMSEVPALLAREIAKAINVLNAAKDYGYAFAVHHPDGTVSGTLVATEPKVKKYKHTHRRGSLKAVYAPYLENLQAGALAIIPCGDYPAESVRAAAASTASALWGKGSHTSYVDKKTNTVQLLRC